MLSKSQEDIEADVERQLAMDPEPGTIHYTLRQIVDRYAPGGTRSANLPAIVGRIPDEKRLAYNEEFVRRGLAFLRIREAYPQGPVMLCRREIDLLDQCLHIAAMALQFHAADRGSATENFAGEALRSALQEELKYTLETGRPSLLAQMPAMAALSAHMRQAHNAIPKREETHE